MAQTADSKHRNYGLRSLLVPFLPPVFDSFSKRWTTRAGSFVSMFAINVVSCTCRRNGLRGLQDRPVDLNMEGELRLDQAGISLEVKTWWRRECYPQRLNVLWFKKTSQNQCIITTANPWGLLTLNIICMLQHEREFSGQNSVLLHEEQNLKRLLFSELHMSHLQNIEQGPSKGQVPKIML